MALDDGSITLRSEDRSEPGMLRSDPINKSIAKQSGLLPVWWIRSLGSVKPEVSRRHIGNCTAWKRTSATTAMGQLATYSATAAGYFGSRRQPKWTVPAPVLLNFGSTRETGPGANARKLRRFRRSLLHMYKVENLLADREGFEPSIRFPVYTLSRRAPSTTRPPVRRAAYDRRAGDFQGPIRRLCTFA